MRMRPDMKAISKSQALGFSSTAITVASTVDNFDQAHNTWANKIVKSDGTVVAASATSVAVDYDRPGRRVITSTFALGAAVTDLRVQSRGHDRQRGPRALPSRRHADCELTMAKRTTKTTAAALPVAAARPAFDPASIDPAAEYRVGLTRVHNCAGFEFLPRHEHSMSGEFLLRLIEEDGADGIDHAQRI